MTRISVLVLVALLSVGCDRMPPGCERAPYEWQEACVGVTPFYEGRDQDSMFAAMEACQDDVCPSSEWCPKAMRCTWVGVRDREGEGRTYWVYFVETRNGKHAKERCESTTRRTCKLVFTGTDRDSANAVRTALADTVSYCLDEDIRSAPFVARGEHGRERAKNCVLEWEEGIFYLFVLEPKDD